MILSRIFFLTLAYFITGRIGLHATFAATHISLFWLPAGISVAALLICGVSVWPGIFLGSFLINLSTGSSLLLAGGIAVGSTIGPVLTMQWLNRAAFQSAFTRHKDVGLFILYAGLGMAISATLGIVNLHMAGLISIETYVPAWLSWWMGDTVGVMLASPFLLTLNRKNIEQLSQHRIVLLLWFAVACPVMWLAFMQDFGQGKSMPIAFMTFPLFVWAAFSFGITGATIAGLCFSAAAAFGTAMGRGTFFLPNLYASLFLLWCYMASTVATGLLITSMQAERKSAEEVVMNLAFYDALTQLPNRRLLMDRLARAMVCSANSGHSGALLLIDLDNFRSINDTLGHDNGDLLLQQVGQRIVNCVRTGDTVARLGGDEFIVLLELLGKNAEEAAAQTEAVGIKILAALNQPHPLSGHESPITPSIGLILFDGDNHPIAELLRRADLAMYQAKTAGRNTQRFFDQNIHDLASNRAALEADMREALRLNQFVLYYQPQIIGENHLTGAEALIRWKHPQRGMVSPAEFIPLAEETGLILPLGHWVLETACAQLAKWALSPSTAHLTLAINVSANQIHQNDFVSQVSEVLKDTNANPQLLKIELTESLLVSNVENVIAKMTALKDLGVGFSLDDFGTGYSSLSYLKRLPLNQLKIDQGFVRDILTDSNDVAIAKMIIALAQSLGLAVIAEGVETEAQRSFLAQLGCDAYQGYLFSRPIPVHEFKLFELSNQPRSRTETVYGNKLSFRTQKTEGLSD